MIGFRQGSKVQGLLQEVPSQVQEKARYSFVFHSELHFLVMSYYIYECSIIVHRGEDRLSGKN